MLMTINRVRVCGLLLVLSLCACNSDTPTSHYMTMKRIENQRANYGTVFTYMVDSAVTRDMSVADVHFVPHTNEINGIGELRLNRMAELLKTYGGTVRYETVMRDPIMMGERLAHVREYLEVVGCDLDQIKVTAMISGGLGLPGDVAVKRYRKGMSQSSGASTTQSTTLGGLTGSSGS